MYKIILLIFLISCEDLFTRFKYQTVECEKNNLNLDKISIKDDSVGSYVDVQFGNIYHKLKIFQNDEELLMIKNDVLDIEINIFKNRQDIDVRYKNKIKRLSCQKKIFKM